MEAFTPLDSMIKLSNFYFPPFCLIVLLKFIALFLTSLSWSLAALNAKSMTEYGTPVSLTPYFYTINYISSILVFLIFALVFYGYDLMIAE